jgi:hypothetical protein
VQRNAILFIVSSTLFVAAFLLLDGPGLARQLLLGAATTAFLGFFAVRCGADLRQIVTVVIVATTGECVLSLGFGLYTYRNALIPAYVPFGHGIFYLLAVVTSREELPRRFTKAITRFVLGGGTLYAIGSFVLLRDQWGLLWWLIAATLILRSRNQLLLSTCVIYTIILELAGTAIGNWRWTPDVPLLGLHSANPPSGVGVLYVLLDLITVAICATPLVAEEPA